MTADMAFECLLISQDPQVVRTINPALDNLSICTKLCESSLNARQFLAGGSTDLVVIDWEEDDSAFDLMIEIQKAYAVQKRTILAIAAEDRQMPGAHLVLRKPVTPESGARSLRMAYSRMLQDYRRHVRYAVLSSAMATDSNNRLVPVTVTNIGDGGIGLSTKIDVCLGDVLSMRVPLSGARRAIYVEARVLWTRPYGIAGCEFLRIPPADLDILNGWLKGKCQIKKPLVEV